MSNGLKVSWEVDARKPIGTTNKKGDFESRTGKNKGPVFQQNVVKILSSK